MTVDTSNLAPLAAFRRKTFGVCKTSKVFSRSGAASDAVQEDLDQALETVVQRDGHTEAAGLFQRDEAMHDAAQAADRVDGLRPLQAIRRCSIDTKSSETSSNA